MCEGVEGKLAMADRCYGQCVVCCNPDPDVKTTLGELDVLSEEIKGIFVRAMDGVNSHMYTSLVRLSETNTAKGVRNTVHLSSKFMVALLVVLSIAIVAYLIFVILMSKGIISVPGVTMETMVGVAKWFGFAVCAASFSYLLLGLGCTMGSKVAGDKEKYKVIHALDRSKLKKFATDHKENWFYLDRIHRELQSSIVEYKKVIVRLEGRKNDHHLLDMENKVAIAEAKCMKISLSYMLAVIDRNRLRNDNKD